MQEDTKVKGHRMKVALVCHSDTLGGAAVVTYRLMNALCAEGVDARMVVFSRLSDDARVLEVSNRVVRGWTFLGERFGIAMANGFSRENLFKVSTASTGVALHRHPWIKEADVVVLNWVNQGMLSLRGVRKLTRMGKPVVWTMHDMWNITGICHHAYECTNYRNECGECRLLASSSPKDLSNKIWRKKKKLYDNSGITFVAVSTWLAECCRRSGLMNGRDVRVIHNAFPVDSFNTRPSAPLSWITLKNCPNIILMGAARLDDPIKGLPYAVEALNYLFDNNPELSRDSVAVFFGDIRDKNALADLRFPHQAIGRINDANTLRNLYAGSKVVLSTSLYETLPGTLIEGLAAGCRAVTFGRGGQSDIVDHKVNGYIADYCDARSVAEGITWALTGEADREAMHEDVRRRFSSKSVATRYIELFKELLHKDKVAENM